LDGCVQGRYDFIESDPLDGVRTGEDLLRTGDSEWDFGLSEVNGDIVGDDLESGEDVGFNVEFELSFVVGGHVQVFCLRAWVEVDRFVIDDVDERAGVHVGKGEGIEIREASVNDDLVDAVIRRHEEVIREALEDWVVDVGEDHGQGAGVVLRVSCDVEAISYDGAVNDLSEELS
jgi:hypothetical protein